MHIRTAKEDDLPEIAAIWNDMIQKTLWTFTTSLKDANSIRQIQDGPGEVFVADGNGELAGFACYSQFRNGPGYANSMEHSIVLRRDYRGQNIGRQLLEAVETDAQRKGFHVMVAGVSSANSGGRAFHEAVGYTYVGTVREVGRKCDQWLDLILLQKIL